MKTNEDYNMKERLLVFIKSQGVSQNAFEDTCGLSRGTVTNLNKGVRSDKLAQIASAYPQLNIRWLLLGDGEMLLKIPNEFTKPNTAQVPPLSVVENAQAVFIANWTDLEPVVEKVVSKVMGGK